MRSTPTATTRQQPVVVFASLSDTHPIGVSSDRRWKVTCDSSQGDSLLATGCGDSPRQQRGLSRLPDLGGERQNGVRSGRDRDEPVLKGLDKMAVHEHAVSVDGQCTGSSKPRASIWAITPFTAGAPSCGGFTASSIRPTSTCPHAPC